MLIQNAAISNTNKKPGPSVEEYSKTTRPSFVSLDEMCAVWETNVFAVLAVYQATTKRFRGDHPKERWIVQRADARRAPSRPANRPPTCSTHPGAEVETHTDSLTCGVNPTYPFVANDR